MAGEDRFEIRRDDTGGDEEELVLEQQQQQQQPLVVAEVRRRCWSDEEVLAAVACVEANHGLFEGRQHFQPCVPGCQVVDQRCVLLDGVLTRYREMTPRSYRGHPSHYSPTEGSKDIDHEQKRPPAESSSDTQLAAAPPPVGSCDSTAVHAPPPQPSPEQQQSAVDGTETRAGISLWVWVCAVLVGCCAVGLSYQQFVWTVHPVESQLRAFYERHDQTKLEKIPSIMFRYRGREDQLMTDLAEKYSSSQKVKSQNTKNGRGDRHFDGSTSGSALIDASAAGVLQAVRRLLLEPGTTSDIEGRSKVNSGTALWNAASNGHADVVRALLEAGSDIEASNRGWTPLLAASDHNHTDVVHILVAAGANIEATTPNAGNTPLMFAALYSSLPSVRVLLAAGARTEQTDRAEGNTALTHAVSVHSDDIQSADYRLLNQPDVIRALVQAGADIEAKDYQGLTAFGYAAMNFNDAAAKTLAELGANQNIEWHPPATKKTQPKVSKLSKVPVQLENWDGKRPPLGDHKFEIRSVSDDGDPVVQYLYTFGVFEAYALPELWAQNVPHVIKDDMAGLMNFLVYHMHTGSQLHDGDIVRTSDRNIVMKVVCVNDTVERHRLLHSALTQVSLDVKEILKLIPVTPTQKWYDEADHICLNPLSGSRLVDAAGDGNSTELRLLLESREYKPAAVNRALASAALSGHAEIAQMLLQIGGRDPKHRSSLLLRTVNRNHTDCAHVLLATPNINLDARGERYSGCTAIGIAASNGNVDLVNALLAAQADFTVRCDGPSSNGDRFGGGKTPLIQAAMLGTPGHVSVLQALLRAGADTEVTDWHPALGSDDMPGLGPGTITGSGATALWRAAVHGHAENVHVLLRAGASTRAKHMCNWAMGFPQHLCQQGRMYTAGELIEHHAAAEADMIAQNWPKPLDDEMRGQQMKLWLHGISKHWVQSPDGSGPLVLTCGPDDYIASYTKLIQAFGLAGMRSFVFKYLKQERGIMTASRVLQDKAGQTSYTVDSAPNILIAILNDPPIFHSQDPNATARHAHRSE